MFATSVPRILFPGLGDAHERVGEETSASIAQRFGPLGQEDPCRPAIRRPRGRRRRRRRAGRAAPTARSTCTGRQRVPADGVVHRPEVVVVVPRRVRRVHRHTSSWEYSVDADSSLVDTVQEPLESAVRPQPTLGVLTAPATSRTPGAICILSFSAATRLTDVTWSERTASCKRLATPGDRVQPALVPRDLDSLGRKPARTSSGQRSRGS